jgi:hypothetical protein
VIELKKLNIRFVLEQPSKEARRVFVLVTKTLQSLANAVKLGGKEPHMARLNDFIEENQEEINQFFDRIAVCCFFVCLIFVC